MLLMTQEINLGSSCNKGQTKHSCMDLRIVPSTMGISKTTAKNVAVFVRSLWANRNPTLCMLLYKKTVF